MKTYHIIIHIRRLSPIGLFIQSENEPDAMRIAWAFLKEQPPRIAHVNRQKGEFVALADITLEGEPLKALAIVNPENIIAIQCCGELRQ